MTDPKIKCAEKMMFLIAAVDFSRGKALLFKELKNSSGYHSDFLLTFFPFLGDQFIR
jgi:hypothetical protein